MHTYSIDNYLRGKIHVAILLISIVFSYLIDLRFSTYIDSLNEWLAESNFGDIVLWIQNTGFLPDIFSVAAIYALLFCLWNEHIWKFGFITKCHKIPNLNGEWEGHLTSSYNGKTIPMTMFVEQTWNSIIFRCTFLESNSHSNVAAICINGKKGVEIYFGYTNESCSVESGMQVYYGYNVLVLKDNHIDARYFNDRPNPNPYIKGGNKGCFTLDRVVK